MQREASEQAVEQGMRSIGFRNLADSANQYDMLNAAAMLNPYLSNPSLYSGIQFSNIDPNYKFD